ncbi:MAG: flagellar biosynthesis protein FlhF [Spirochaetaceae bacterium]|jgi:flagellar biosynthesis protein FlhF|nr:flagellar biosynthesis protein FlhF [Spirochaetaceae bacterium]
MEMFTVRAKTREGCLKKIREIYGERVEIWNQATVRTGGFFGIGTHEEIELKGYVLPSIPDFPKNRMPLIKKAGDSEDEKQKILVEAAKFTKTDPKTQEILSSLKAIQETLDEKTKTGVIAEHENLIRILDIMELNDFLPAYRRKIVERAKKELPLAEIEDFHELQQRVLEWIGETIIIANDNTPHKLPRIIALVGPTGVGKTTTIAKLAVSYLWGYENSKKHSVSLITIDRYRLAAVQQLEDYAKVLDLPFASAGDADELKKCLALEQEGVDIILIDTIGRSPRDAVEIAEMQQMLSVCGSKAEVYLAVAASTKAGDIIEITRQFEPFAYKSVIVTKLDETMRAGNIISALAERGKSISYITCGQESTPKTIKKAAVTRFLINLEGFEVDRARLEKRFADEKALNSKVL